MAFRQRTQEIGSQPEILFAFKYQIVYCDNTDKIGHCVCDDILVDGVLGVLMVRFVMVSKDMLSDVLYIFDPHHRNHDY